MKDARETVNKGGRSDAGPSREGCELRAGIGCDGPSERCDYREETPWSSGFLVVRGVPQLLKDGPLSRPRCSVQLVETVAGDLEFSEALKRADEWERERCEDEISAGAHYYALPKDYKFLTDQWSGDGVSLGHLDVAPTGLPLMVDDRRYGSRWTYPGLRMGDSAVLLAEDSLDCMQVSYSLFSRVGAVGVPASSRALPDDCPLLGWHACRGLLGPCSAVLSG